MRGRTTVYLNQHMNNEAIEKPYVCIDTFAGFTSRDVAYEFRLAARIPGSIGPDSPITSDRGSTGR